MATDQKGIPMIRGLLLGVLLMGAGQAHAQLSGFDNRDYHRADSVAALYQGEDLTNLPILAHKLTADLPSELEKFRAIYTWVATNIENDYGYYLRNKQKRKKLLHRPAELKAWNEEFRSKVFKKLLKEQSTICTGYAYLVRELANFAGIDCHIIDGYGRTAEANVGGQGIPNHSWNAVRLNNKWYLCDATWSSGSIDPQKKSFVRNYNDGYFLAAPELFARNHYPLDSAWLLTDTQPTLQAFLEGPLVYKHAFSHQLQPIAPATLQVPAKKSEVFVLTLKTAKNADVNQLTLELKRGKDSRTVKPEVNQVGDELYELHYSFKQRGKYDVHLKSGKDYIVTYTLNVK
ncbi:transglutaminase domain-containing protein [Rapidithrix thailandica]|uniref:Transglutaminase domain-containing protein n=1 Tax=Rapidithrix thailandica TaxID=413964 RepID=A0AAW9S1W2_9BACT